MPKDKDSEFAYGFTLIFNGKMQTFRSKEEDPMKEWLQALAPHCVFLDFEKKYKMMNKLGSGGYAKVNACGLNRTQNHFLKVYLVEEYATNKQYAAKMINFPKQDKTKDKKKHRVIHLPVWLTYMYV